MCADSCLDTHVLRGVGNVDNSRRDVNVVGGVHTNAACLHARPDDEHWQPGVVIFAWTRLRPTIIISDNI